jgi:hypothetical protein
MNWERTRGLPRWYQYFPAGSTSPNPRVTVVWLSSLRSAPGWLHATIRHAAMAVP